MADVSDTRVAVYLDFDNIVISRYDQVHGRNSFQRDRARLTGPDRPTDPEFTGRLAAARVDIGAIIDFAASFGTLVLTRAYADWSAAVNAGYRGQLVSRAVDLVQLFPAAAYAKNGADIRLAVDAVEDMFRLPDLTHVVIVGGDSDYIALAQRCRRLGRYVVGIGVAGSTSRSLAAACDELVTYDALPGVAQQHEPEVIPRFSDAPGADATAPDLGLPTRRSRRGRSAPVAAVPVTPGFLEPAGTGLSAESGAVPDDLQEPDEILDSDDVQESEDVQEVATGLLERALRLGQREDDEDWLHTSQVKTHMKRMDPSFSEKTLGYRSFSDFLRSRGDLAELDESSTARLVRLAPEGATPERA